MRSDSITTAYTHPGLLEVDFVWMISFQFIALAHLYIQRCAPWTPCPVRTRVEAVTVMLLECQNLGAGPPYALRGVADDASFFPPFYCNRSVFPLWILHVMLVRHAQSHFTLKYHTFRKMTTPSNTLVRLRYFSSSSSARSPCASSTGVLCVCHPVMVFGRPAWPTMSTA